MAGHYKQRYATAEARAAELERGREKYARLIQGPRAERKRALIMMLGGACSICGYNRSAAALDFDHLENGDTARTRRGRPNPEKRRTVSHLLAMNTDEAFTQAIEEAQRCRLVCSNCHRELTYPGHELESR